MTCVVIGPQIKVILPEQVSQLQPVSFPFLLEVSITEQITTLQEEEVITVGSDLISSAAEERDRYMSVPTHKLTNVACLFSQLPLHQVSLPQPVKVTLQITLKVTLKVTVPPLPEASLPVPIHPHSAISKKKSLPR